jgi:uncharacterized protein (UPF0335 family)
MSNPRWLQPDGEAISCRDKLKVLDENHTELSQTLHDVFEDAVLMGVDAEAMRAVLAEMVAALRSPLKKS